MLITALAADMTIFIFNLDADDRATVAVEIVLNLSI